MKSHVVKPEFLGFLQIFKVKILKRKPEKVCMIVRFCAADITSYINGLAVYRDVFSVLPYFTETESSAKLLFFAACVCDFNTVFI